MKQMLALITAVALMSVPALAQEDGEEILALGDVYVADDGLWEETNGLGGLQREETVLDDDEVIPADDAILTL